MATTKKAPAKKATTVRTKKATSAKKPLATKKVTTVRKPVAAPQNKQSFMTLTPTIETVYWAILGGLVIVLAIWVASLTIRVQNLYDQIEIQNAQNNVITQPHHHDKKPAEQQ